MLGLDPHIHWIKQWKIEMARFVRLCQCSQVEVLNILPKEGHFIPLEALVRGYSIRLQKGSKKKGEKGVQDQICKTLSRHEKMYSQKDSGLFWPCSSLNLFRALLAKENPPNSTVHEAGAEPFCGSFYF